MFPAPSNADLSTFLDKGEGAWKGLFIPGLKRVICKTNASIKAKNDALDYVEKLLFQLLAMICARPYPHTLQDVHDRVQKLFPHPVDEWANEEATKAVRQGKKKSDYSLAFPNEKIHPLLKEWMQIKIDHGVTVYICAVLEYVAADVIHLVGKYVKYSKRGEFTPQDIKAAVCCDKVLCDLFKLGDNFSSPSEEAEEDAVPLSSYNEVVDDLLQSDRQYLRDLQMLIKVFREQLADKLEKENESLELVFQTIEDITELTVTLISQVEDNVEMTEPGQVPAIGNCFLELAENWDFDVYDRYAEAYCESCQKMLEELLSRPDVEKRISTAGRGYVDAVKFYFPKLLLEPFHHCLQYFDYIKLLYTLSRSEKDKTDLLQADSVLTPLKTGMNLLNLPKKVGDANLRISGKGNKRLAQRKFNELKAQVDGFSDFGQTYFNEFLLEGELVKISSGKRISERYGYLFDGIIFLCKPVIRRTSVVTGGPQYEYRLKERFYLTRVEVHDKEDMEDLKFLFEIVPRNQPPILIRCHSHEEKRIWMSNLVMLTTKSMLDRLLDRILLDEEKKHPLRLPSSAVYRFAVPDSDNNIVFDRDGGGHMVIKGATLLKLVERLTHHQYSDPSFVNTFLTTYRSFCSPHEFLDLLIERFNIPDPDIPDEESESIHAREMLKRFRKEYSRHIQLRVLNVVKQWVIHHFYDFERDPSLQTRLEGFLESCDESRGKSNIFESVRRCLKKAAENVNADQDRNLSAVKSPPPFEYHIRCAVSDWNILTFHPVELARQLSILEFDYYRVVKPSELVGSVWTKKNKDQLSPNLLKMIKHTTNVTRWFERSILDTENYEERVAVVSRILEVMFVMQDLNNFNGVLAVVAAMGSASVYRLSLTTQGVPQRLMRALEEAQELQNDHYKRYQERLRSINPPCVPFFGMYLTNILHIEEGNLDYLPNSPELINFSKRRKVAEITSEIRQFQYSHYSFAVEPRIREYLEKLQPFPLEMSETDISNYLYEKSLEIEPRGIKQPPKFPRKYPEIPLKSPGIKRNGRSNHPGPLLPFSSSNSLSLQSLQFAGKNFSSTPDSANDLMETSQRTPKTPSSIPSTSSPQDHDQNDSDPIFAPVFIGGTSTYPTSGTSAPPLPPKPSRTRQDSLSESLSPWLADTIDMPPPLPPRRISPRGSNCPNPPPRRNSSVTTSDLSPHANQPPISPTKRLTNGPPTASQHSPSTSGLSCASEHQQHHSRFPFSATGNSSPILSPTGSKPEIPMSPPKLPPKANKPLHNP